MGASFIFNSRASLILRPHPYSRRKIHLFLIWTQSGDFSLISGFCVSMIRSFACSYVRGFGILCGNFGILILFIALFFIISIFSKYSNRDLMLDINLAIVLVLFPSLFFLAMKALKSVAIRVSRFRNDKGPPMCSIKKCMNELISL